jgi:hypothetical protein
MALASLGEEVTVLQMRQWVASSMTQEHLEFYRVQAEANPHAAWLNFARVPGEQLTQHTSSSHNGATRSTRSRGTDGGFHTLAQLRDYVRRCAHRVIHVMMACRACCTYMESACDPPQSLC